MRPTAILEYEVALQLERLYDDLRIDLNRFLRRWKLTVQQYNVLGILDTHGGTHGLPSQKLRENLTTRVPDITRILDRLVRAKLVERVRSPQRFEDTQPDPEHGDRRVVRVRLTEQGQHVITEIREPVMDRYRHRFAHLTPEELRILKSLLVRAFGPDAA